MLILLVSSPESSCHNRKLIWFGQPLVHSGLELVSSPETFCHNKDPVGYGQSLLPSELDKILHLKHLVTIRNRFAGVNRFYLQSSPEAYLSQ